MSLVKCIEGVRSEVIECRWPSTCPMRFASQRVEEDGVLVSGHIFQPRPLLLTIESLHNTGDFMQQLKSHFLSLFPLFISHKKANFYAQSSSTCPTTGYTDDGHFFFIILYLHPPNYFLIARV